MFIKRNFRKKISFISIDGSKLIISRLGIQLVRIIDRWGQPDENAL